MQEAYDVGLRYEATLDRRARDLGAYYTPPAIARGLTRLALERSGSRPVRRVVDPTCGGGAFLVAAADALVEAGLHPSDALAAIHGADIDPGAVAAANAALEVWAGHHGLGERDADRPRAEVLDGFELLDRLAARGGADVVVGNPPFRSQLRGAAVHDGAERGALRARFGAVAHGYTDLAGLFLVAAVRSVAPGGVVGLVQPRSVLVAANAAGVRGAVLAEGDLAAMWLPEDDVFEAQVQVCAPLLVRRTTGPPSAASASRSGSRSGSVAMRPVPVLDRLDREPVVVARLGTGSATWSPLVAAAQGVPRVDVASERLVGDVATVVAGFRDEYYGLVGLVAEADDPAVAGQLRLATAGSIEVGRHLWGERPQRFGRRRWEQPVIDAAIAGHGGVGLRRWWDRMGTPKVLVATQTRVVEAVADPDGVLAPVTPVISVVPDVPSPTDPSGPLDPHAIAAALCSPVVAALAQQRVAGSGMSPTTMRLRAADVAALPLPSDGAAWELATEAFRTACVDPCNRSAWRRYAALAVEAHGHGARDDLVEWWLDAVGGLVEHPGEDRG